MKHIVKLTAFTLSILMVMSLSSCALFLTPEPSDKANLNEIQNDFRSFQVAFEIVAKEKAGFNILGWDTGDISDDALWLGKATPNGQSYTYANKDKDAGDKVRNSYDEGDANLDGMMQETETWTGTKIYTETWTNVYTLVKPGTTGYDAAALFALESDINRNIDPIMHISIDSTGKITMLNEKKDPWGNQYEGLYMSNVKADGMDRGLIIIFSKGENGILDSEFSVANGSLLCSGEGDDYLLSTIYTYKNGYGQVITETIGFSR